MPDFALRQHTNALEHRLGMYSTYERTDAHHGMQIMQRDLEGMCNESNLSEHEDTCGLFK